MLDEAVKYRLWLTMVIMVFLVAVVGGLGVFVVARGLAMVRQSFHDDLQFVSLANEVKLNILQLRRYEKDYFLNIGSAGKQADYLQKYRTIAGQVPPYIARLDALAQADPHLSGDIKDKSAALAGQFKDYLEGFNQVLGRLQADPLIAAGDANNLMVSYKGSITGVESGIEELDAAGRQMLQEVTADVIRRGQRARTLIILVVAAGAVLAGTLGTLLSRSIQRAIFREGFRRLGGLG